VVLPRPPLTYSSKASVSREVDTEGAEVPCDDAHAERSFGRSWRLRCDACRDAGANHADDLAGKLARAIGEGCGSISGTG
jgi:hypothetical protein